MRREQDETRVAARLDPSDTCIAERGRLAWHKTSGYPWHALVEADISRFKRVIGDGLRSRTGRRRATEHHPLGIEVSFERAARASITFGRFCWFA